MERLPHIMLIGGSDAVLAKIPGMPLRVTYAQRSAAITPLSRASVCRPIAVEYTDSRAMLAIAGQLHTEDPLDAVISVDEYALSLADEISVQLGIAGCGNNTALMSRNKHLMRERLCSLGVDSTRYRICENVTEAERFAAQIQGGVILKPADGAGGAGVHTAATVADVAVAWDFAKAAAKQSPVLAEEQVYGQEYSVETITARGRHTVIAITQKTTTGAPYFVEIGHATSGDLTRYDDALPAIVCAALDAIGVEAGACHTEVIARAGQFWIVEINTRMGGAFIWEIVELATGIDLFRCSLTSLLGTAPDPPSRHRGAAIAFAQAPAYGLVRAVPGVDRARAMRGVVRIDKIPASGTMVYPMTDRSHRLGCAITVGETVDEARCRARDAADALRPTLTVLAAPPG